MKPAQGSSESPIYSKTNPADTPILTLALTSAVIPLPQVEELADTRFAQKIPHLAGVGLASISGGQRRPSACMPIQRYWLLMD